MISSQVPDLDASLAQERKRHKVQNKGTQGARARYNAELPPFVSVVGHPSRPIIVGMDLGGVFETATGHFVHRHFSQGESNMHQIVVTVSCRLLPPFPKGNWPFSGTGKPPPLLCGKSYHFAGSPV